MMFPNSLLIFSICIFYANSLYESDIQPVSLRSSRSTDDTTEVKDSVFERLENIKKLQRKVAELRSLVTSISTCGRRQVTQAPYIIHGYEGQQGDYPWHAALYHKTSRSSSYKCGGTLINKHTIITAAHCLYSNGRQLVPEKVSIQLGKHILNIFDANTVEHQVFKLIIHPEFSPLDLRNDLALVRLETIVEYNQFIFPACLWSPEKKSLENVIGRKGSVVGWGLTEDDGFAEVLNAGTMPVVGFLECLESNRDFFGPFLSDFNYCAGYRNGTNVCNGDSGGGMFFQENGLWTLRGLVSFSTIREDSDVCNPHHYVIFTDVAKYLDWIKTNM